MSQTTPNTPLARVKAGFGSKKDLIEKVRSLASDDVWIDRLEEAKSWSGLSNAKLLRLHAVLSETKQRFGSREKLVDAVAAAEGHGKDADYKKRLASWPLPRLLDALKSAEHRTKLSEKKGTKKPAAAAKAAPAAKAPAAKATGAKKPAAAKAGAKGGAKPSAAKKTSAKKPAARA